MTRQQPWDELHLSENPAVELLQGLGYTYVTPETLERERDTLRDVVLTSRLAASLKELNPWISEDNVRKAIKAVTGIQAASLIEANEKAYTVLTYGISVEQDRGDGKKGHSVQFFDFDHPERNDFIVTRQYKIKGTKKHIIPDVVVLVNGIPLVVIECKSPTLGKIWLEEAIEQLHRYQELGDSYKELGAPKLFETVHLLVGTCGQGAFYGTTMTPTRFFAEWKKPWPQTVDDLEATFGRKPSAQDVLLSGMLDPKNLLDIIRNFIVFERDPNTGKTVKKVCRYQQFGAVNKAAERARKAKKPTERGGVVWHTQGSGKSLTMLWLALKLRRDPAHDNPTLVIVTDRRDLDEQITKTFTNCGFPNPERAASVRNLKHLLRGPTGKTVLTTVQKFQELSDTSKKAPVYSSASNIFVFVDEAHRTQYKSLAANMRSAVPNAAFFGFTGTPIDKRDRSTLTTFGPYIDTYTIEQAVADGATVPIFYESRLPELRILGSNLDALFDRVFADRSEEEREAIKAKYAKELVVAGAPKRIETICLDLLDHYTNYIQPNGFKAQIVGCTREAAVIYKETLDKLNAPQSAILISGSNDDEALLARHHTEDDERKKLVERFLKADDPLCILVVCDMLLTGFDAPIEQVMYLDSPLREHTLLQAIARVNRTADGKKYGLIVDYWGVSEALQEALAIFSPSDIKGAMQPKADELPRLQARHQAAMRFFVRVKNKNDLDGCVAVLEPEDVRAQFNLAFRRFSQSLDMVLPDPKGLPYVKDMKWLGKVRQAAAARFRDHKLDVSDCGAKVRKLIEDAISAEGIQILVQRVGLFTKDFDDKLNALKSDDAKASEMEHAIRDEIHVKLDEDPAFYTSLRERLERIIEDGKAKRIDAAKQLELFQVLIGEIEDKGKAAEKLGLSDTGHAIYGLLSGPEVLTAAEPQEAQDVASKLETVLEPHIGIIDWQLKDDVQREMRRALKKALRGKVAAEKMNPVVGAIVDMMKARRGAVMPLEMSEVHFGNTVVPYRILRSTRRRTVSIAIDPTDGVVVTAPAAATIAKLDDIVHRKAGWVLERLRRRSSSPPPPLAREYVSGETFLYLGRHYRLKVQPRAVEGASVRLLRGWLTVTLPAGLEANERASRVKTGLVGWYRQHAGKRLPERVAEWSGRVGVDEPKVLVREQRKRWASCDKSGVLRFNWRIIQAPMPLVDYVVAHELVHLVHPDHTPEFWGRLGRAMPDYEGRRERLRDAGKGYEW